MKKKSSSHDNSGYFFFEGTRIDQRYYLSCTINTVESVLCFVLVEKLFNFLSKMDKHIASIEINPPPVNKIQIKFNVCFSLEFYQMVFVFTNNLLINKFKELTKLINNFESKETDQTSYKDWLKNIIDYQDKALKEIILTNLKSINHYNTLIDYSDNCILKDFAVHNKLSYVNVNQSSDSLSPVLKKSPSKDSKSKTFDFTEIKKNTEKYYDIQDLSKCLVVLPLGELEKLDSFFQLLIKIRLLQMNLLISVLKNSAEVIKMKEVSFNKEVLISYLSVGALMNSKKDTLVIAHISSDAANLKKGKSLLANYCLI